VSKKWISSAIRAAVFSALLVYLALRVDYAPLWESVKRTHVWLFLLSVFAGLAARWFMSWQTALAMRLHGAHYSTSSMFSVTLRSLFYGFFLPGDLASAAVKYHKISKLHKQRAETFATIVYLRLINLAILFGVALIAMLLRWPFATRTPLLITALALFACALAIMTLHMPGVHSTLARIGNSRAVLTLPSWFKTRLMKLFRSMGEFHRAPAAVAILIWLSGIFYKLTSSLSVWFAAEALGVHVGLLTMLWVQSVIEIVQMLPITLFNFGTREVSLIYLLGLFGTASPDALAISLLLYSQRILQVLWGGLLELGDHLHPRHKPAVINSDQSAA
jgi:uncharacterized protein (TIRG00374 family)